MFCNDLRLTDSLGRNGCQVLLPKQISNSNFRSRDNSFYRYKQLGPCRQTMQQAEKRNASLHFATVIIEFGLELGILVP